MQAGKHLHHTDIIGKMVRTRMEGGGAAADNYRDYPDS